MDLVNCKVESEKEMPMENIARLYCPDFSSVFGLKFANPFFYENIDSQIWPIFNDFNLPKSTLNLLALRNNENPLFYNRNINSSQLLIELECGNFGIGLAQAIEISNDYGIPNELVLEVCSKVKPLYPILSINLNLDPKLIIEELKNDISKAQKFNKDISAVVIYPGYLNLDFSENVNMNKVIEFLNNNKIPLKIDITDLHLPFFNPQNLIPEKIISFINKIRSKKMELPIIISGVNPYLNISIYSEYLKWDKNIFLELNHRSIGGTTPKAYFNHIFSIPGFINNWWYRIMFGSGTPTLEPSQLTRGLIEATEHLNFTYKNLLRTWGLRNGWRIFPILNCYLKNSNKEEQLSQFHNSITLKYEKKSSQLNNSADKNQILISYDILIQSFSITQLISIQSVIEKIFQDVRNDHPDFQDGLLIIKTYHTTNSIIMNEHELGNYLQLHYYFSEKTAQNADETLHTVAADEFRADFNFSDHLLALNYGERSVTYPIRNGKLIKGSREHLYCMITFGPRIVKTSVDFLLNRI